MKKYISKAKEQEEVETSQGEEGDFSITVPADR
jgi:hypothetical protein